MYKDITISILGALLLEPVFKTAETGEQIAMVMGLAAMLFIFAFFARIRQKNGRKSAGGHGLWSRR
ncbi:LPXTG cell wall anchor domain-containing protein [Clostridium sp. AF46-9NS]|nr:LPXTG cell wall anchor domain-containing protein [Clostridium sp. AF46-9NS]